jgi:hypothetical protein
MLYIGGGVGHLSQSRSSSYPTEIGTTDDHEEVEGDLETETESEISRDELDKDDEETRDDSEVDDVNLSDDGYGSA